MAKEITDLVEATVLNDADLILARQGSEDKKALISTLIDRVNLGLPIADTSNKGIVDKELILQLLLLVDGSGSGLDADKLDGEEGAFYRNADNINTGTVPTDRLPSATTTQKGIVQKATTIEAETGVTDKFPDAAGVLSAIAANASDLLNTARTDVVSATTVDLTANAPDTRNINITGSTSISTFTVAADQFYFVRFDASLTLVNNASLVTQSGENLNVEAGATCALRSLTDNVVEILFYTPPGGWSNSLASTGWQKLPSGLILQWGYTTSTSTSHLITLPLTFPGSLFVVIPTVQATTTTSSHIASWDRGNSTLSQIRITTSGNNNIAWVAIGI